MSQTRASLTLTQIEDVRNDCLADDLPILDGMDSWSEDQVRKYFESGGVEKPNAVEDTLKGIGNAIGKAWNDLGSELAKIGSPPGSPSANRPPSASRRSKEARDSAEEEREVRRATASQLADAERDRVRACLT